MNNRKRHALSKWKKALKLQEQGLTYRQIGARLNVSGQRAFELVGFAKVERDRPKTYAAHRQAIKDYQHKASLSKLRSIANAFYHLSEILPPDPNPTPWPPCQPK